MDDRTGFVGRSVGEVNSKVKSTAAAEGLPKAEKGESQKLKVKSQKLADSFSD